MRPLMFPFCITWEDLDSCPYSKLLLLYSFVCRYYHVTVNIGHQQNPYFLDIDSGSDLTWLQCDAPCTKCTPVIMVSMIIVNEATTCDVKILPELLFSFWCGFYNLKCGDGFESVSALWPGFWVSNFATPCWEWEPKILENQLQDVLNG